MEDDSYTPFEGPRHRASDRPATAEIIQIRDYQHKRDLAVIAEVINSVMSGDPVPVGMEPVIHIEIPYGGQGIDGMLTDTAPSEYVAPLDDPA